MESYLQAMWPDLSIEHKVGFDVKLKSVDGSFPEVDPDQSSMNICRRYFSIPERNEKNYWVVQIFENKLVINYGNYELQESYNYSRFFDYASEIVRKFRDVMKILFFNSVELNYKFCFNYKTIPNQDLAKKEWLEVKKLLNPFFAVGYPKHSDRFLPPYSCEQQWEVTLAGKKFRTGCFIVTPVPKSDFVTLDVFFGTIISEKIHDLESIKDILFGAIREVFDIIVTSEAMDAFANEDWK